MWGNSFGWGGSFMPFGFILPLMIWSVLCTGFSLWHAAKREETGWFIFFLFVHTAGIIELFYLLTIVKIQDQKQHTAAIKKRTKK